MQAADISVRGLISVWAFTHGQPLVMRTSGMTYWK